MEVGAVKQAFNNELILLKKKLVQAKIQVIHKLTRKAKTLADKQVPEKLKEKLTRKAEHAVKEVLIIKKIKPKDIAKFTVTHTEELETYLNKPQVDLDKACARLLLHKLMQDKYKFIRNRFSSIPIEDLLMSRQERRKLKKEAKEKQKNKKKDKNNKIVNSEGDWDVEDVDMAKVDDFNSGNDKSDDQSVSSDDENDNSDSVAQSESEQEHDAEETKENDSASDNEPEDNESVGKFVKLKPQKIGLLTSKDGLSLDVSKPTKNDVGAPLIKHKDLKKITSKKLKDTNKNKNLNDKLISRKFSKKDNNEAPALENKIVDPFFITATGENYMSVAEPRQPDEVKEIHKQGNRKLRRAAMFGHVPKIKPRRSDFVEENNRFNKKQNGFEKGDSFKRKSNNNFEGNNNKIINFKDRNFNNNKMNNNSDETKTEKLHPSWEAKKKQSGILPFQGKKIVFDEG